MTHGLQCWLHKGEDPFYVAFLANIMWSVCDEYTWALPAHVHGGLEDEEYTVDLFASETACCLAENPALHAGASGDCQKAGAAGDFQAGTDTLPDEGGALSL